MIQILIHTINYKILTLGVGASSVEARVVKTCSRPRVNAETSGGGLVEGISWASDPGAVPAAVAATDGGMDGRREAIFRSNTEGIGGGGKRNVKVLGIGSVGGGGGGGGGAVG